MRREDPHPGSRRCAAAIIVLAVAAILVTAALADILVDVLAYFCAAALLGAALELTGCARWLP